MLELAKREGMTDEDDFEYHEFEESRGAFGDKKGKILNFRPLLDFLARRL